ncbi:BolA family protein [Marinimicrobium alkaliphilum]|uniref:BolA family protein n=1 Tax=Marinimicrobium alkaliphilum TaxID=2202654 RepID=UPI000DBA3054|nr:BolA/IbaG family iron-sulfur metabolism protein [Marinimicrobium alkaliphilum]
MQPIEKAIRAKIATEFEPQHLEVINESYKHSVPPGSESHFKVVLVSPAFAGQRLVQRHQAVYAALREELDGPVHALALHTHTPEEWAHKQGDTPDSPNCLGGSKADPA